MNKDIWEQIKNIDKKTLIKALERDNWQYDAEHNRFRTYRKGTNKIKSLFIIITQLSKTLNY